MRAVLHALLPAVLAGGSAAAQRPGPSDVHLVALDPGHASLAWTPVRGAAGYLVARIDRGALTPQAIATPAFEHRTLLRQGVSYAYLVTALYPNGDRGTSAPVTLRGPVPRRPNVTATRLHDDRVRVVWDDAATGAAYHVIEGSGIAGLEAGRAVARISVPVRPGEKIQSVETQRIPPGSGSWTVTPVWTAPGEPNELREAGTVVRTAVAPGRMITAVQ